jgi:C4-type Zn-finger protein
LLLDTEKDEQLTMFCPKCGNEMDRVNRTSIDKLPTVFSFGVVKVKRYLCVACLWEKRKLLLLRK